PVARGRAFRYMTIGCALRGELINPDPAILRRRIQHVLAGGSVPPLARAKQQPAAPRFLKPLLGLGVAASVAIVAVGVVRYLNEAGSAAPRPTTSQPFVAEAVWNEPPSYTVPQDLYVRDASTVSVRPVPTSLLLQHGENASGLSRLYMYSSIVAAQPEVVLTSGKPESSSASVASPSAED